MTIGALTILLVVLSATILFAAEADHRFVRLFYLPITSEAVVIAEGDLEPRSLGSYTLRIYGARSSKFPTDDFIAGAVRPRNGAIEAVRFTDVDGDNRADVVVLMRSAGSGGYLAADAFRYSNKSLELIGSVAGIDKEADGIRALRDKLTPSTGSGGH